MRWRCDWCWVLNAEKERTCVRCGRDIEVKRVGSK